ncbi:helix-turn-helix domain-containing protein, partial [Enterococcus faecium]
LLDRIWNFDFAGQSRIVDVHVSHLREKIERDPKHPKYLVTIRGFGYKFQEPKR